jgi:hypothetical protein
MNRQGITIDIENVPAEFIKKCLQDCNMDTPLDNLEFVGKAAFTMVKNLKEETLYTDEVIELKSALFELDKSFKFNMMLIRYNPNEESKQ